MTDEKPRITAISSSRLLLPAIHLWRCWQSSIVRRSAFIILLFLLALLPRMFRIDTQSLWLDEGGTWQVIQQGWVTLVEELWHTTSAYPLYHLLLKGWVALFGDSEWALRLPSALAGAGAVAVIYFAAQELEPRIQNPEPNHPEPKGVSQFLGSRFSVLGSFPLTAALLLFASPFAIWYAQDAKVYSLLLLVSSLLLWSLLRAIRLNTWQAWLLFAGVAFTSVFVHRLAVLLLIAAWVAWLVRPGTRLPASENRNLEPASQLLVPGSWFLASGSRFSIFSSWFLLLLTSIGIIVAMVRGLGSEVSSTGAYIPADPGLALWLTFLSFTLDRGPGEFPWWWLLPWAILVLWGTIRLLLDLLPQRSPVSEPHPPIAPPPTPPRVLGCFLVVPLALFLAQLAFTHLYEARYLMLIYPAWILLLAYPVTTNDERRLTHGERSVSSGVGRWSGVVRRHWSLVIGHTSLITVALVVSAAVLVQPGRGLFSGYPVKEQYREAITIVADRVHPDDAVILHPNYLRPMYDYYMRRLTTDPPPEPITFEAFKHLQTRFNQRDWDEARRRKLAGYVRSFLVIAPVHAYTVDRPPTPVDEYGQVGLYFQYSRQQEKWPCGIWRYNGVHVFCQDSPEAYETGEVQRPTTTSSARLGAEILLQGYTLKSTTPAGPGVYQAGGSLSITLFWDVTRQPEHDYSVFLHLCQECDWPPIAGEDAPPFEGYLPTSVWLPGKPVHDERSIPLPLDMPSGRYTLLLGMYRPGDASETARLPVQGAPVLAPNRLVLATVEIIAP